MQRELYVKTCSYSKYCVNKKWTPSKVICLADYDCPYQHRCVGRRVR